MNFNERVYINESNETIAKNIVNMENKDFCYTKQWVENLGGVKVARSSVW